MVSCNKVEEVDKLVHELIARKPTDSEIVSLLVMALKKLKRNQDVLSVVETALNVDPGNDDLAIELIFTCIRVLDFKKASQVTPELEHESIY